MNQSITNQSVQKISDKKLDRFEFSELVTEKLCSLVMEGKIMIPDQMKAIETLCNIMQPKTVNQYRTPLLNHYNSVKGAIEGRRLMSFRIGTEIFIPKQ